MSMKALVIHEYGPAENLKYEDIEKPVIQGSDELIIKVKAAGVNPVDFKIRKGYLQIALKMNMPAILGIDFAGIVDSVGENVHGFKIGDEVYGKLGTPNSNGSYAEFIKVDTKKDPLLLKPSNLSFEEAAAVGVTGFTAFVALVEHGKLEKNDGKKVLVIGASGGVGYWTVQLAKALGANVTGICSTANVEFVKSLGADHLIDYKKQDIKDALTTLDQHYDIVVDCVGGDDYWKTTEPFITKGGVYSTAAGPVEHGGHGPLTFGTIIGMGLTIGPRYLFGRTSYKFISALPNQFPKILDDLLKSGEVKSIVNHSFKIENGVDAHLQSESNRTVGKIVLTV
ncbi:chaperonin 10-like protein [Globomyces pollinis-pini]|nr:chaperonin 10-like protein [Globomyces pollinis-pini]